ncbi:MAG TPA: response regulator [Geobacteraceae bacterium]|jgi:DNA-binding response OmpR family regulator|nr:response regulator [Geobacteraceae bacterium]
MRHSRILIVEDDGNTADFLNLLLSQSGYHVTDIVHSGEDAIREALLTKPDLVLMDIKLGGHLDGIESCEQIKKSTDIPIIFVSAHSEEVVVERVMQSGASAYILKPFKNKQLIAEIDKALKQRKLAI